MTTSQTLPHPGTTESPCPPVQRRSDKIGLRHLERMAVVYVRQSTPQQMVQHQESTKIQYNLRTRAADLGWQDDRILVIDDDLGKSGTSVVGRAGFQRLVTEVTLDHVGVIFGVEMSRLARSCKDWYQLLDVCAVFGTLIADLDGIYDPSQFNDRLLLGLKGTMSEAELHIIKQRMDQGRLQKARRGELVLLAPTGYVRSPEGLALDPDEQVREIVKLVFSKFEELGTVNAVLQFLVGNGVKIPVRARGGPSKGEIEWKRPCRSTIVNLVKNPTYAGAYAYGRRKIDPRRKKPGRRHTGRTVVPPEQCQVFIKDRFPAYISWEQFEQIQARLQANRTVSNAVGVARNGPALLAGLVVCGKCGHRMTVYYKGGKGWHSYNCVRALVDYGQAFCQCVAGPALDRFVSEQVLKALEPASLELSLEAARNIERQRDELEGIWEKRIERARYEAERAERQYNHVEPENRLVARHLEQEWEEKLRQQRKLDEEHERLLRDQPRLLSAEEREAIRNLADDIPALWNSPETTMADRKEILRQVIDRVAVEVVGRSERVNLVIHWAGGTQTSHETTRPVAQTEQLSYWPQMAERIRELAGQGLKAKKIAEQLNIEGWKPPKQHGKYSRQGVQHLMHRLGLCKRKPMKPRELDLGENEWPMAALARELEMSHITLFTWARRGSVKSRRDENGRWILWADKAELERLREIRKIPSGHMARRRWIEAGEGIGNNG